ncbi:MAG: hypothetical protein COA57_02385 [Flavobacteriales bacterium]|nr:MAG: hypothetical protein COA57_02385 [Flavobacteriales bacterium]
MNNRLKYLIITLLLFSTIILTAQQKTSVERSRTIDSLQTTLPNVNNDTNKVNLLNKLAGKLSTNDPKNSLDYARQALELAKKLGFKKGQAVSHNNIAFFHVNRGNYHRALENYFKALKIREELKDKRGISSCYNSIGNTFYYLSDFPKALDYYFKALKLNEELHFDKAIAISYANIGMIYYKQENLSNALEHFQLSLKTAEKTADNYAIANACNNIGVIQRKQASSASPDSVAYREHKIKEALDYYDRSLKLYEEIGDKQRIASTYNNLGGIESERENQVKALYYFNKALKLNEALGDKQSIALVLNNIGSVYSKQRDFEKAVDYMEKSIAIAKEIGAKDELKSFYKDFAGTYEAMGDFRQAYQYHQLYAAMKDTVLSKEMNEKIAELQTLFETEQKEQEIINLKKDQKIKNLAIGQKQTQIFLLIAGIIALVVVGFLLYNWYRSKQKEILNTELIKQQELRLKAVVDAQEEERKRIAKDLHDGIGQMLTGLKLSWQNLSKEIGNDSAEMNEKISHSSKILDETSNEVRSLSHQMMPRALSEAGIVPAMEDMLDKALSNSGISFEFEHFGVNGRYGEDIELALYRITQELMNNILKHADAKKVNVQLLKNKNLLVLVVEDNGKGFNFDENKGKGLGLMNISARVKLVNGKLNYEPGPEKGTVATVRIPIV